MWHCGPIECYLCIAWQKLQAGIRGRLCCSGVPPAARRKHLSAQTILKMCPCGVGSDIEPLVRLVGGCGWIVTWVGRTTHERRIMIVRRAASFRMKYEACDAQRIFQPACGESCVQPRSKRNDACLVVENVWTQLWPYDHTSSKNVSGKRSGSKRTFKLSRVCFRE